jgi:hypothetical protein
MKKLVKKIKTIPSRLVFIATLWVYSLLIPTILSFLNVMIVGLLDINIGNGFVQNFNTIWFGFYYDGKVFEVLAWRWHLFFMFVVFGLTFIENLHKIFVEAEEKM